jgi:putative nucleotidyltransferase with HDIG domain
MQERPVRLSERLDRLAYSTFVLGAVVPLCALAVTLHRFVIPTLDDRASAAAWILAGASIGVLSLGSFFALRRLTRRIVAHMDRDNHQLSSLLQVSSKLADAQHLGEATQIIAGCCVTLTGAEAAFVFAGSHSDAEELPSLAATGGEDAAVKIYEEHRAAIDEAMQLVIESNRPVIRSGRGDAAAIALLAVPMPGPGSTGGAIVVASRQPGQARLEDADALSTLAALASVALHNADLRDAQRNFFSHVTDILMQALDAHLQFHVGHGERVAQLANRVGRALSLDDASLLRLHFGALLHDVGMLKLDRTQQMNPRSCDKHTQLGARMLARIRLWKDLAPIVHHHHECWDGHGYPDGLAGAAIPLEARIIAICDAFDTMTSDRSYKDAVSTADALNEIRACSGSNYDPELVRVFVSLMESGEPTASS